MEMDRKNVITHLQIIHTWASFARERDLQFFTPKHLEDIAQWSADAIALLKEQEKIIQNILLEKANELNDKVTTLQIEAQNREIKRLFEQK